MTWCVNESDLLSHLFPDLLHCLLCLTLFSLLYLLFIRVQAGVFDCECSDGLRDGSILLSALVMIRAERVEQRRFTVVHMAHNRDNRRSCHKSISLFPITVIVLMVNELDFNVELHADEFDRLVRQNLKLVGVNIVRHLLGLLKDIQRVFPDQLAQLERVYVPMIIKQNF